MKTIVNIDVPDLERAVAFYCAALDLELARTLDDDVAELSGATCLLYLLERPRATPSSRSAQGSAEVRRYDQRHWTPVHADFVVDDVERAAARAERAGAVREGDVVEWRGSRCITFADPFGHGFCLIEFEAGTYL